MDAAIGDLMAGDVSADRLGVLYETHAADALRLAYLLTGDRTVAQDLVQDAFVKVAGRLTHLRRQEAFGAYLRVTVVNLARMRGRRLKVERDYLDRHRSELREPHRDPDVAAAESLRLALNQLPFKQRAAIVLRFFDDVPGRDHRAGAGVSPGDGSIVDPPRAGEPASRPRGVGAVNDDEFRRRLDRLAKDAPSPDAERATTVRAARRRARVGIAITGVVGAAAIVVGVVAVNIVIDRPRPPAPSVIGPAPTGTAVPAPTQSATLPPEPLAPWRSGATPPPEAARS